MNINAFKESKYLKKEDVGNGVLMTIRSISHENVAKEGADPEMKYIMHFDEADKGLVMNSTNAQLCAQACKSDETDDWIGKKIVLFTDPSVSFGGKLIGGIRIRAQRLPQAPAAPAPRQAPPATAGTAQRPVSVPPAEDPAVDDVPF